MARASYHKMGIDEARRLRDAATRAVESGNESLMVVALNDVRRTLWREYQMGDAAGAAEGKEGEE